MSSFSTVGASFDGDVPTHALSKPSPIFIPVKINQTHTEVMLDSGSSNSFIRKDILDKMKDVEIRPIKRTYVMADGCSTFNVLGTVKIFIEIESLRTDIVMGVVDDLCVNCILGMNYISKYALILNNRNRTVVFHVNDQIISIPMRNHLTPVISRGRTTKPIQFSPYEEKQISMYCDIADGDVLFSGSNVLTEKGLITASAIIPVVNHFASIFVYNSTITHQLLKPNDVLGQLSLYQSTQFITTVFDAETKTCIDEDQTTSVTSNADDNVRMLIKHISDKNQSNQLWTMFRKHHQLFNTLHTTIAETDSPHVICTDDKPPPTSRPYPQTLEKQNITFDIIQQMLKNKQIRPSKSQYSAPILLIKKSDGTYRFIVDYRKLNNITVQDKFPLPNLEQAIQLVGGYCYYTKFDLRSGYFQIPINEQDKAKTAFVTIHGLFEFNVLAQGLKNSPPSFQRIMSNILLPCKQFCIVYLDDVLVYSKDFDQHLQHVNQVLALLNKHKFQFNPPKCEVFRNSITYLGHTISSAGIRPLQDRIDKLLSLPQPTSLNEANAFIGAVSWYKKFIPNYAVVAAPILAVTNLTKKYRFKFDWGPEQRDAFEHLKLILTTEPLFLTYPIQELDLILAVDASDKCVGGVLFQEDHTGDRRNIYFHSQMLPKLQRKWPTIEKEALAIYYCVSRMKLFLLGREFIVYTDHCPLRNMHQKPSNNRRVDRISLILQQFHIKEIRHLSGSCNCMADYLSRYPRQTEDDDEFIDPDFGMVPGIQSFIAVTTRAQAKLQRSLQHVTDISSSPSTSLDPGDASPSNEVHFFDVTKIGDAQKEDPFYKEQSQKLLDDSTFHEFVLESNILFKIVNYGSLKKKLLFVPSSLVTQVIEVYHVSSWAGHFGFRRTYNNLKDRYWWPNMKISIQNYLQSCLKCQQFNFRRHKEFGFLHPVKCPSGPFQMIGIDYSGPFPVTSKGNKYVLAVTDYFTKWVIAIPLEKQNAQLTAQALYEKYICIYGVPRQILSDQGSVFNNQLFTAFTQILGCHHIKSTPYHPQTNGAVERFNATFERQLAKFTNDRLNDWDMHIGSIVFAYNTGIHATTEFSPYQLQFGRQPNLPPDRPTTTYEFSKPNDYFPFFKRTLSIYHRQAHENILYHQRNFKRRYNVHRPDPKFHVGDQVLRRLPSTRTKLASLFSAPMKIVKTRHPTYWIQDYLDANIHQVHVSQLRACRMND